MSEENLQQQLRDIASALEALPLGAAMATIHLYKDQYTEIAAKASNASQLIALVKILDELDADLKRIKNKAAGFRARLEEIL